MTMLEKQLWAFFAVIFCVNCAVWSLTRERQAEWLNVPPVPGKSTVYMSALGDGQLAYRSLAVMLQNLGDTGGRVTPLRDYDFDRLAEWFYLMHDLDPQSDYIPYLASFYFGAVNGDEVGEKLRPLVGYLYKVGKSSEGEKWRWLAHGIYLARFKMNDLDYAYDMALDLAELGYKNKDMPHWTRQMPVFILNAKGDKEAALSLMMSILSSVGDKIHPSEVNYTRSYICEQILTPAQAAKNPVCQGL